MAICLLTLCANTGFSDTCAGFIVTHKLYHVIRENARGNLKKGGDHFMDNGYIIIYTPYITRKGVRIWAYQYGLKAFRLCIPKDKYRR